MNSDITNYNEFYSEPEQNANSINATEIKTKESYRYQSKDFSFSSYYGKKFCCLYYFLIIASILITIGGLTLLFLPFTNQTYLNNLRLEKLFTKWESSNCSSTFGNYSIVVKVISSGLSIDLIHLSYDPLYLSQKYYKPSLFYLNMSMNDSDVDLSKLQQKMGSLNLKQTKEPLGASKGFCLNFIDTRISNSSAFMSNFTTIQNLTDCIEKAKFSTSKGLIIIPWQEIKIYNLTYSKCKNQNGIFYGSICYTYFILKEICFKLKIQSDQLVYDDGCYKSSSNTTYFQYEQAILEDSYDFSDFAIFVRLNIDPYVALMNFSNKNDVNEFQIYVGFLEQLIPGSIFIGLSGFTFFIMTYFYVQQIQLAPSFLIFEIFTNNHNK